MSNRAGRVGAIGAMAIISIAVGLFCGRPAAADPLPTIDVKPAQEADERVFLVAAAKRIHEVMRDTKSSDPDALLKEIQELARAARQKAVRLKVHIEQQKLDAELVGVYQDLIDTADAWSNFADQIGRIRRLSKGEGERNNAEAVGKGLEAGAGAAASADQAGADSGDAAVGGLIVGLIAGAIESNRRDEQLREQVSAAVNKEAKTIDDRRSLSDARLNDAVAVLAKRYGWKPVKGSERVVILTELERNPIGQVTLLTRCQELTGPDDPDKLRDAARVCEQAVRLVPEGQLYDEYRLYCLESAGRFLFRSVHVRESTKGLFRGVRNADASHAAALYEACLKYSADPAGALRSYKAWMLAADNQMNDAIKLVAEVSKLCDGDANFAYWEARLLSATGNTDLAFDWLSYAVRKLGYSDITGTKTDPDLAKMRAARQKDFDDLVAVKWSWRVKFGVFNDDFVLTNNSAFAITNVRVQARLVQGDRVWNLDLKTDRIAPGAEHLWENVVSIPGSHLDNSSCSVTVDCQEK